MYLRYYVAENDWTISVSPFLQIDLCIIRLFFMPSFMFILSIHTHYIERNISQINHSEMYSGCQLDSDSSILVFHSISISDL